MFIDKFTYTSEVYSAKDSLIPRLLEYYAKKNRNHFMEQFRVNVQDSIFNIYNFLEKFVFEKGWSLRFNSVGACYHEILISHKRVWPNNADDIEAAILISDYNSESDVKNFEVRNREMCIDIFGDMTHTQLFTKALMDYFDQKKFINVKWHFRTPNGITSRSLPIESVPPIHDEFYPWLKTGVKNYQASYLNSDSNILIMLGDPGTGKTTLIRDFIYKNSLRAVVTFDESLLNSDQFFIKFLMEDENDVLVIEDADLILTSRQSDGNKVMSKLLNISDGIVKLAKKKIIFTANIRQVNDIDEALTRPGRCFDIVEFRSLTYKEAVAAAQASGVGYDKLEEGKNYTLAEIFSKSKEQQAVRNTKPVFGFV